MQIGSTGLYCILKSQVSFLAKYFPLNVQVIPHWKSDCVITVHNGNLNTDVDTSFNLWTPIRMAQHNLFNFFLFNQFKCILLLN